MPAMFRYRCWLMSWTVAVGLGVSSLAAWGGPVQVQAVAGEPFGVGKISFPIDAESAPWWQCRAFGLSERSQRILLPVLQHPGLLRQLASQLDGELPDTPSRASVYFLFTGDAPLHISLTSPGAATVTVVPEPYRLARHGRLARQWWNQVWGPLADRWRDGARPRPVENYVAGMGLWRLDINRHPATPKFSARNLPDLLTASARLRADMLRAVAFGTCAPDVATGPLPTPIAWSTVPVRAPDEVVIEEIAQRVPDDCFYVRFGKYSNLLWATRLLEKQGEELQRLVTLRGFRSQSSEKIQQQLAIRELPFADLLGDRLIADVALIGRDAFLHDGPAVGVILQSKGPVLAGALQTVRQETVRKLQSKGATATTVEIEGQAVSFISTPDNSLRSFHVVDGPWNLLTNSRAIATGFLQLGKTRRSLADVPAFRQLRCEWPADPQGTAFVYLSTRFLESVTAPAYVVELQRRLRARAELNLLEVAVRVAAAEAAAWSGSGRPTAAVNLTQDVVTQLQARQLLPPGFACRCDGSRPVWQDGRALDSLRGALGVFLPIPDIGVQAATAEERRVYQQLANQHRGLRGGLDPVAVSLSRQPIPGKPQRERLQLDLRVTPLQPCNASLLLGLLGQSQSERIKPPTDSLITGEVLINSCWTRSGQDTRCQLSVLDGPSVEPIYRTRLVDLMRLAQRLPALLLIVPGYGALDGVGWRASHAEPAGQDAESAGRYCRGPLDLVGRQLDDYAAVAFDRDRLADLPPVVSRLTVDEPAQAWVQIKDLKGSSLADCVTGLAAVRALRGSVSNAQLFHQWTSLLNAPVESGPELVERLVGLQPVCPLGGEYQLPPGDSIGPHWSSTAWPEATPDAGTLPDYEPALLQWWHGLDAALQVTQSQLRLQVELEVEFEVEAGESGSVFSNMFGGAPARTTSPEPE